MVVGPPGHGALCLARWQVLLARQARVWVLLIEPDHSRHRDPKISNWVLLIITLLFFCKNLPPHNHRVIFSHHSFFVPHHDENMASGTGKEIRQLGSEDAKSFLLPIVYLCISRIRVVVSWFK